MMSRTKLQTAEPAQGAAAVARELSLRSELGERDRERVCALTAATAVFSAEEVAIAKELVDERLARGPASGYEFVLAEHGEDLAGYACYGPIPAAEGRYDLYWIVVDPRWQRAGLGSMLLAAVEERIAAAGGVRLYVDTAGGDLYAAARAFYLRCGFRKAAEFPDFYTNGDAKVVYAKPIEAERTDHARVRRQRT